LPFAIGAKVSIYGGHSELDSKSESAKPKNPTFAFSIINDELV